MKLLDPLKDKIGKKDLKTLGIVLAIGLTVVVIQVIRIRASFNEGAKNRNDKEVKPIVYNVPFDMFQSLYQYELVKQIKQGSADEGKCNEKLNPNDYPKYAFINNAPIPSLEGCDIVNNYILPTDDNALPKLEGFDSFKAFISSVGENEKIGTVENFSLSNPQALNQYMEGFREAKKLGAFKVSAQTEISPGKLYCTDKGNEQNYGWLIYYVNIFEQSKIVPQNADPITFKQASEDIKQKVQNMVNNRIFFAYNPTDRHYEILDKYSLQFSINHNGSYYKVYYPRLDKNSTNSRYCN